jgi:hypothetical protein
MPLNASYERSPTPESVTYDCRILGTGAADPTLQIGADGGFTVTRTGAGVYRFQLDHNPGKFITCDPMLCATTPSALKQYAVVPGDYDATNFRIDISVFNAAGTATDLAAAQFMHLMLRFARTGVAG